MVHTALLYIGYICKCLCKSNREQKIQMNKWPASPIVMIV